MACAAVQAMGLHHQAGDAQMIVMKFGGTSVESAEAIERVAGIVRSRQERRPVVVGSAMGRTTNKLLAIAAAAIEGRRGDYIQQIHDLRDLHSREARLVVPLEDRAEAPADRVALGAPCPYCGERVTVHVEPTGMSLERYVEDCPVCCRPWVVSVERAEDGPTITLAREDD